VTSTIALPADLLRRIIDHPAAQFAELLPLNRRPAINLKDAAS
jgi:hypothetical protein